MNQTIKQPAHSHEHCQKHYQTKCESGFTLIEVMVALAILAVVAVASYQASVGYINTITGMKTRTLAHFVAQNTGAKLKINNEWLGSVRQEKINAQGRSWQVSYAPSMVKEVPSQNIQSVNINVAEVIEGTDKTGAGTDISVMLTKPND